MTTHLGTGEAGIPTEQKYFADLVTEKLKGFKIEQGVYDPKSGSWAILATCGKRFVKIWIDRDSEGNGPGAIDLEFNEEGT